MFAASRSNKRPIFTAARQPSRLWRKLLSFCSTTIVVALATWGGVLIAEGLGGTGRTDNAITRWINTWVDKLLAVDPVLAAVLAAVTGFVCIAFFVRDHN